MAETKRYISQDELKSHNKRGDVWISIQGKIYDVSDWAKEHPGGEAPLLSLAGQDVTDVFVAFHPDRAWQYLDKFFNGYYLEDYSASEVSKDYRKLLSKFSKMGLFEKKGHGVEHHLFPRLPRNQLRKISPFVKELCKKHNLPYNMVSFWEANVMTIGTLRAAALQARDITNPVPKNLVWEAVNTHG